MIVISPSELKRGGSHRNPSFSQETEATVSRPVANEVLNTASSPVPLWGSLDPLPCPICYPGSWFSSQCLLLTQVHLLCSWRGKYFTYCFAFGINTRYKTGDTRSGRTLPPLVPAEEKAKKVIVPLSSSTSTQMPKLSASG